MPTLRTRSRPGSPKRASENPPLDEPAAHCQDGYRLRMDQAAISAGNGIGPDERQAILRGWAVGERNTGGHDPSGPAGGILHNAVLSEAHEKLMGVGTATPDL